MISGKIVCLPACTAAASEISDYGGLSTTITAMNLCRLSTREGPWFNRVAKSLSPLSYSYRQGLALCLASSDQRLRHTNGASMDETCVPISNPAAVMSEPLEAWQQPQAELCAVGRSCITAEDLGSVAALADWLMDRLPSGNQQIFQWGRIPGTKRLANLWLELSQGEISLEDSRPPIRTLHVACVKITNGSGKMLLEAHQEMADGSIRERNRPLSEKMKPGESVEEACLRGMQEELGSELQTVKSVTMLQHTYRRETQERESFSYPGLMTCYVLHHMEARAKHLPADDFVTDENELAEDMGANEENSSMTPVSGQQVTAINRNAGAEESAVGVKRHFWKWVPETVDSVLPTPS